MKIKNIIKTGLFSLTVMAIASCSVADEIKSLEFDRDFSPVDFKAEVVDKVNVNLTWTSPQPSDSYVIELFKDSVIGTTADSVLNADAIGTEKAPFVISNLQPNTVYTARIKGVSKGKQDSKWTALTEPFETKKEAAPAPKPVTHVVTFTEFAAGAGPASWGDGKFVITPVDPNGKMVCDANNCYFYEMGTGAPIKFTTRLKSGGKSSATANFLNLTIPGDGKLYIYVRTGSNGDTSRDVIVTQNDEVICDYTLVEDNMKTLNVEVEGEAAPVSVYTPVIVDVKKGAATITYPVNGINFYGFTLVSLDSEGGDVDEPEEPAGPVGEGGLLTFGTEASAVADGAVYTFGSAAITINNGGGKFAIDTNTQYFGDATSQTKHVTRMKTGAKNSDANGVALTLEAKGTLTIAMRSSSSSADRAVSIIDATGTPVATWTVGDSNATADVTIEGEAEPKKVFHTYTVTLEPGDYNFTYDGGLNFYSIKYEP